MNAKKILALLLALVTVLSLAACSKPQQTAEAPTAAPGATEAAEATAPVQEAVAKDEVTIGFSSVPSNYDPLNGFTSGIQIMFAALVQTNEKMEVVADLASDYTVSDDALTYTFTLRDDIFFSDGTPITPADVVFSFETAMNNATSLDLSIVKNIIADGQKIVIELSKPRSTFILTVCSVGIVPQASYGEDFALNPVCSGPYVLAQYDVDQQFILEANEHYYGGMPAIRRVVFVKMADEDTRLLAAQSGQVDVTLTSAAISGNRTIPGYVLHGEATVDNFGISLPVRPDEGKVNEDGNPYGNDITCDIAIRKALAYGLDRRQICDDALYGYATPAFSENDGMPWYNPESEVKTDVAYAVQLLEEAGWVDTDGDGIREKDGNKASMSLLYFAGDSVRQAVAMSISNQAFENLGIEIIVEGAGEDLSVRMFKEPMILAWGSSNPMTSYMLFHSSNAGRADWYNPEFFTSDVVDGYLDAAMNAKTLEEAIPFWQKAQWDGETGTSMRGEAPYIFILNKTHLYWVREGLDLGTQKIHAHGDAWPLVQNLRDWKWN